MDKKTTKSQRALTEERILAFWKEHNVFQKTLEKDAPKGNYVFYDGPPFATGQMHYGHILGSTAKDAIGRYQTMQGFHVPRRWGWDCHGLPIENIVEKELGIAGHKEIEAYGIEKFVEYARSKVLQYEDDWESGVERIGRWVNFRGGYKTMDNTFIESVWWALSEMNKKGLVYEGVRVLAYCPRCETPIANSEIAMDNSYKDITDISVYVKFELIDEPGTYLLAWTTTPWTLPGNFALAVNPNFIYVKIKIIDSFYILAKDRLEVIKEPYEIVEENVSIIGKSYKPLFDYFLDKEFPNKGNAWKVYGAEYVTNDAGTGIVHISPAHGEEDMELAKRENIPFMHHVLNDGTFAEVVRDFMGLPVKPRATEKDGHQISDIEIIKHLAHNNLLFAKEKIVHAYPHCMRCDTPIIYYALPSWFINIQKAKANLMKQVETMIWIPAHLKEGRFNNILEGAPDWTISRNRYWASPLPIWKSNNGKLIFIDSLKTLKEKSKKSGNTYLVMRHGQTEHNLKGLWNFGDSTDPLTEEGKEQVITAAQAIKNKNIDVIITSPFNRTLETATIIAEQLGLSKEAIITDDRIAEWNAGSEFDDKPLNEYFAVRNASEDRYGFKTVDGESYADILKRSGTFLYDIDQQYKDKTILVVSHGAITRGIELVAQGFTLKDLFEQTRLYKNFDNAEVRQIDFVPLPHNAKFELDYHRPYIDRILLVDEEGNEYVRIPEVIDCWFESGSMPFAQDHYPFERQNWHNENFPADFVVEYIAQTRTWFYYTSVVSSILFDHAPFKHVVTTGTLRAEDGQKISKSKKNYPDPWIFIDKYGVDALRFYLMSGTLMKGEDANFSEKIVADIANKIIGRLYNVLTFYELYRDKHLETESLSESNNGLDQWIVVRLNQLVQEVTSGMEHYDMAEATRPFDLFVDDLSTWYLRRSRDRVKDGDTEAKRTLYRVLKTVSQLLAPFAPFAAEDLWATLKSSKSDDTNLSVHLTDWPAAPDISLDEVVLLETMIQVRAICTQGNALRKKLAIPVRQPLLSITVRGEGLSSSYLQLIQDELNVKAILFEPTLEEEVMLDTTITPELKAEGEYRELVRAVQDLRKAKGLQPSDPISLTISPSIQDSLSPFMNDFKKTVLATAVTFAENEGEVVEIGGNEIKIQL